MIVDIFIFIFGLIVGSFLNVCIVRLPHEQSVVSPRSHCVHCKKPIAWYDNIPLLSYILLGGKCRYCHQKFSFRYFFVELLTAVSFWGIYRWVGFDILLVPYFTLTAGFIVATFVDFAHRIIPDEVTLYGILAGFVMSGFIPELHHTVSYEIAMGRSLLGFLIGGGIIWGLGMIGDMVFRKETMGGGDIKLLAMIGSFLGWQLALLTFFVAPFFGAVYGIIEKIRTKDSHIAYGPFLILAAVISMVWGNEIINFVISGYGYP